MTLNMTKLLLIVVIAMGMTFTSGILNAQTLHAIIVANIDDQSIGKIGRASCRERVSVGV